VRGVNLGDSGALVLRYPSTTTTTTRSSSGDAEPQPEVFFKTEEQCHRFNFPFQLGTNSINKPSQAASFAFVPQPGDMLLLATDGVLDNLFPEDMIECIQTCRQQCQKTDEEYINMCARSIATKACERSIDERPYLETPWQRAAMKAGMLKRPWRFASESFLKLPEEEQEALRILHYTGGKPDDITVVIAMFSMQIK